MNRDSQLTVKANMSIDLNKANSQYCYIIGVYIIWNQMIWCIRTFAIWSLHWFLRSPSNLCWYLQSHIYLRIPTSPLGDFNTSNHREKNDIIKILSDISNRLAVHYQNLAWYKKNPLLHYKNLIWYYQNQTSY